MIVQYIQDYIYRLSRGVVTLNKDQVNDIISLVNNAAPLPYCHIEQYEGLNNTYRLLRKHIITEDEFMILKQITQKRDLKLFKIVVYNSEEKVVNTIYSSGTGIDFLIYKFTKQ